MITNTIEKVLESEGTVIDVPVGSSMYPLLKHKETAFVITVLKAEPCKNDVVLFKRNDTYVLHRIIKSLPKGYFRIRGDNCLAYDDVKDEQIIGIMIGFYKGKRYITCKQSIFYKLYLLFYRPLFWVRKTFNYTKKLLKRIINNDNGN